jgi:hypothetical protein
MVLNQLSVSLTGRAQRVSAGLDGRRAWGTVRRVGPLWGAHKCRRTLDNASAHVPECRTPPRERREGGVADCVQMGHILTC